MAHRTALQTLAEIPALNLPAVVFERKNNGKIRRHKSRLSNRLNYILQRVETQAKDGLPKRFIIL